MFERVPEEKSKEVQVPDSSGGEEVTDGIIEDEDDEGVAPRDLEERQRRDRQEL